MTPLQPLELLAPAKDAVIGKIAIDHGADAVYIGGPGFGARAAAGNPMADIAQLCTYAHRYHARIFLTLNTLLFDDELEAARAVAWQAWDAGVDALIVQDLGLLELDLPPIELHASTQCDIRTPEKAVFLEKAGFSQVVLARELTLEEVAAIHARLERARIEYFVHGALCVSYSGQCYLSCAECGRSANRGECSQPCRRPYQVIDFLGHEIVRNKHVLSMKDNDQSANLAELVRAGVSSFKIEGRLKDAGYVKNITAWYRQKLDALLEGHAADGWRRTSLGKSVFTFTPNPEKTFHRSATDYFAHGRQEGIAELDTGKSTGEFIGRVARLETSGNQERILVKTNVAIANGDGLAYLDPKTGLTGLQVNRAEEVEPGLVALTTRERLWNHPGLKPGTLLQRNRDRLFAKALEADTARRSVPVTFTIKATPTQLTLTAQAAGATVSAEAALTITSARNVEKAATATRTALERCGETMFDCAAVNFAADNEVANPFLPASALNNLRREVLEKLEAALIASHPRGQRAAAVPAADDQTAIKNLSWTANVANGAARRFWVEHGALTITPAFEVDPKKYETEPGAPLMRCRHCVRYTLQLCPRMVKGDPVKKEAFMKANGGHMKPEPLTLVDPDGRRLIARFDCKACEMTISLA